jgi:predicted dehydrogenase
LPDDANTGGAVIPSETSSGRILRFAVTGTGSIVEFHLRALQGHLGAKAVALYGRNEERTRRMAQRYGLRPYTDFADLLDEERPDALLIASAHHLHEPLAEVALERGVHTLVEKPLALTPEGAARLVDLADKKGCRLAVVYQKRYNATVRRPVAPGVP